MLDLSNLSQENLEKVQKVLKIVLDTVELQELNRLAGNKIPLKSFEKEGFCYEEVKSILNKIGKEENDVIQVINEIVKESLKTNFLILESPFVKEIFLKEHGFSLDDLYENKILLLQIKNLNKLKGIKENVDKKLQERAITRAEEIRGQFAEMDEKQEEKESLILKEIKERVKKHEERKTLKEEVKKEIIEEIQDKKAIKKRQVKEIVLYLNQNGDLYRKPRDKYCYPMGEKGNRHRIIRFLAMNKGYQFTEFISTELGIESEKTIRTEIGKMRSNIEKYLKIDGNDFLQGKKESGYRINPKYKVILKNE